MPEDSVLDGHLVRGLSDVDVLHLIYDPSYLLDTVMPAGQPLGSFNDHGETVPYWILAGKSAVCWWLARKSVAMPLLVVALLNHDVPVALWVTPPIVGFALVWLMLSMDLGGAWRVGTSDSNKRILAHVLAVVVPFLVLAAISSRSWLEEGTDLGHTVYKHD